MNEAQPFRRRVTLTRTSVTQVAASVEDHIHHFEVQVDHDNQRVCAIQGRAVRAPWSTCPGATRELDRLIGERIGGFAHLEQPMLQCTHLLDLAVLAIRFAGQEVDRRWFEVSVVNWAGPSVDAQIQRDDGAALGWTLQAGRIVTPAPYEGRDLRQGFAAWAHRTLAADELELALILRRAVWMSVSRGMDLDQVDTPKESGMNPASCYASQPVRFELGRRNHGSSISVISAPWTEPDHAS